MNMPLRRVRLGMLTPSSNTALEPLCQAMVAPLPGVSVHFARFRVTQISLSEAALGQFELAPILEAARLLADARCDVIAWNGTSAGWRGFETDEALCEAITRETGIPACTSVLALNHWLRAAGLKRPGFVTPYLPDVQRRIVEQYARHGWPCGGERHLSLQVNYAFAEVEPATLAAMAREVVAEGADCVLTFCTNLRAAQLAPQLEAELGVPLVDTVSTAVWQSLRLAGVDPRAVRGYGRLFQELAP